MVLPFQSKLRFLTLALLLFTLPGCRSTADERAKTLMNEGTALLRRDTELTEQWSQEYRQTFNQESRAQFPSNRDWMISRGEKMIAILDESNKVGNAAADKFEEIKRLMGKDQDRKGMELVAASIRKGVEINHLLKAQAQLASDRTINDAKIFDERFDHLMALVSEKRNERDKLFAESKRLVPWK